MADTRTYTRAHIQITREHTHVRVNTRMRIAAAAVCKGLLDVRRGGGDASRGTSGARVPKCC
eukprot:8905454-Pyramimonas_sp.AAC.2